MFRKVGLLQKLHYSIGRRIVDDHVVNAVLNKMSQAIAHIRTFVADNDGRYDANSSLRHRSTPLEGQMTSCSGTRPMTRAGFPTTIALSGTSFVTTEPAPTNAFSPTVVPGHNMLPPPTRAPWRMRGACSTKEMDGRR